MTDTPVARGTSGDDGVDDDDASDDSTPPPPPPRPNVLTAPTTTPTPSPDHPMYVAMDAYASAAYVAFSSLSLVNSPPQPTQSPSAEPPPSVDNTGASLDNNITSVGQQGVIDKDNINDHDSNNNDDDEVGVPLDRKDSVASMLTPPSPIVSQLPSPSRLSFRNNSHHSRLPHRRCQKTAIRPSTMPSTTVTKPTLTTPPQSTTNGNNNFVVDRSATTGGHVSSSSAVGYAKSSRSSSSSSSSSGGCNTSNIATSSRVLGPTFSDLMRRLVRTLYSY